MPVWILLRVGNDVALLCCDQATMSQAPDQGTIHTVLGNPAQFAGLKVADEI